MHYSKSLFSVAIAMFVAGACREADAVIKSSGSGFTLRYGYHTGPGGGLDTDTLHYWSLDETETPFLDTGSSATPIDMTAASGTDNPDSILQAPGGALNLARRLGTNGTGSNRITAFTAVNGISDNITADQANSIHGSDGAITVDMLLRPDFDSTLPTLPATMRLITEEGDSAEARPVNLFLGYNNQADVVPSGAHVIEFRVGDGGVATQVQAVVPFEGPDALATGSWYHLAVIYNGDETATDNVRFYWTKVDGISDTTSAAHLLSTATIFADPTFLFDGPEFTIGNETNGGSNKSWFGALDEIRISGIDRDPNGTGAGFIFEPSTELPGDYNKDGEVDAADYVVWRDNPTSFGGNPDGYHTWRANFGAPSGSGTAVFASTTSTVPEPISSVLIVIALATMTMCRVKCKHTD